jgi:hypothetical protein
MLSPDNALTPIMSLKPHIVWDVGAHREPSIVNHLGFVPGGRNSDNLIGERILPEL